MYRTLCASWAVALMVLVGAVGRAEEKPALRAALALEEAMQDAIAKVEPAVACILVSRSDGYRQLGQPAAGDRTGHLGSYDLEKAFRFASTDALRKLAEKLNLADPANVPEFFGSGVVLDPSGLILTNYHVVRDATRIFVRLPGRKGSYADIFAADPRSDLAVLRLLTPPAGLTALPLGDGDAVRKGQFVISLANPFAAGFADGSPSASWGILSNVRRRAPGNPRELDRTKTLHHYGTLLQTDARLNLGCSGGALVNLKGELIGVTTALAAIHGGETAGGYAVPMGATMRRIVAVLKRGEEVEYGFLGVGMYPTNPAGSGVRVRDVTVRGPADRAGLRENDVILSVNDVPVRENDDLFLTIGALLAGSEARLRVQSAGGGTRTLTATLAKFHYPGPVIASKSRPAVRGLRVDYQTVLTEGRTTRLPAGVVVREVLPGSAAERAGLKVGDTIAQVNDRAVNAPPEFQRLAEKAVGPLELTLDGKPPRKLKIP